MTAQDISVPSKPMPIASDAAGAASRERRREPAWLRLKHLLLTRDQRQQVRLAQSGLAIMLMMACVAMLHVLDAAGVTEHRFVWPWTIGAVGGMVFVFMLIRSGRVTHWRDPSLTMQQMLYAVICSAMAYCITGTARATVIPILGVVLMFGMFGMTLKQVVVVAIYTLAVFGGASLYWIHGAPVKEPIGVEIAHFMMVAIMLAGVVILTARLHGMRERSRRQRAALSTAVDRIRELATRDELTGCFNRRAMLERMSEELLRSARTGAPMCLVLLDLDHFKKINDLHGHAVGDQVLRGFADIARGQLRGTDVLGRWGGEEFLLMLPGADARQGELGVQRVLQRLAALPFQAGSGALTVTCSAGLAQRRQGESILAAIERADRALYRAKHDGRNRLVCAE